MCFRTPIDDLLSDEDCVELALYLAVACLIWLVWTPCWPIFFFFVIALCVALFGLGLFHLQRIIWNRKRIVSTSIEAGNHFHTREKCSETLREQLRVCEIPTVLIELICEYNQELEFPFQAQLRLSHIHKIVGIEFHKTRKNWVVLYFSFYGNELYLNLYNEDLQFISHFVLADYVGPQPVGPLTNKYQYQDLAMPQQLLGLDGDILWFQNITSVWGYLINDKKVSCHAHLPAHKSEARDIIERLSLRETKDSLIADEAKRPRIRGIWIDGKDVKLDGAHCLKVDEVKQLRVVSCSPSRKCIAVIFGSYRVFAWSNAPFAVSSILEYACKDDFV